MNYSNLISNNDLISKNKNNKLAHSFKSYKLNLVDLLI